MIFTHIFGGHIVKQVGKQLFADIFPFNAVDRLALKKMWVQVRDVAMECHL